MRRARFALLILTLTGALALVSPVGALAAGCNGSAGDSQYFDPLQSCGSQSSSTGQTHSSGQSSGSTTTPTTTPSAPTATTAVASSTTTRDPKSSKSLPFTGLDLGPAIAIGLALLGGGLLLRRLAIRGNPG